MVIKVEKLLEAGIRPALLGLALSYKTSAKRAEEVSYELCQKGHGENKFLQQVVTWWLVRAPRYWWQEADTYRLTVKQSESTMHTIGKREFMQEDFEDQIPPQILVWLNSKWISYKMADISLSELKMCIPEGYMQTRIWMLNYGNLREIITQRHTHRLPHWRFFCQAVYEQVERPEWLPIIPPISIPPQDTSPESPADA